ncbi:MGDG synthase family glycosyltransferase [Peptostreptococcus faecalis]|uniref:MGDG synthase family glycosyltransferase n=1 Tax=Peptostreptococcus faecalis TaxID=2045015 RepID=UPI000C797469|nr:glycosyltransferase [Peptostreptococcus faecalis]
MKIVILTAKYGMGHVSAANSIKQDILKFNSEADVEIIDYFEYTMPTLSKFLYKAFNVTLKYAKELYSLYYLRNDRKTSGRDVFTRRFANMAEKLILEKQADVIVSTFPLISQGIGLYKKESGSKISLVTCITDVSSHYEWINDYTNRYLVPSDSIMNELVEKGVKKDIIISSGIPVSMNFRKISMNNTFGKNKTIKINKNKELLIMGGGFGILPEEDSFYKKLNSLNNIHTTIVTGNNKKAYEMLHGKYDNITVVGFTNKVYELLEKADCIITKPGGITVFESIYSLTPIISLPTTLPNEVKNVDFIYSNNFGFMLDGTSEKDLDIVERLLNDNASMSKIKKSMSRFVDGLNKNYYNASCMDAESII